MIFPMYVPALGLLQIWGFLDNIKSHLGYEFFQVGGIKVLEN